MVELLSHISFFIVFLTVFYVTFVGFIQGASISNQFTALLQQAITFMAVTMPSSFLQYFSAGLVASESSIDTALTGLVDSENDINRKLLTPVFIGIFSFAILTLFVCFIVTAYMGESVNELIYGNLISITFIAITDLLITTMYGQLRTFDSAYLAGLFAQKTSGGNLNCNVVEDTLFEMFPESWIQSIIKSVMGGALTPPAPAPVPPSQPNTPPLPIQPND